MIIVQEYGVMTLLVKVIENNLNKSFTFFTHPTHHTYTHSVKYVSLLFFVAHTYTPSTYIYWLDISFIKQKMLQIIIKKTHIHTYSSNNKELLFITKKLYFFFVYEVSSKSYLFVLGRKVDLRVEEKGFSAPEKVLQES